MHRKPNSRALATAFLAASAALSVAILAARNLYDDEISSFDTLTLPFTGIVRAVAQGDVHPPGMYLLAHLAYRIIPSFRWMNLFPLLFFYAGLAFFVLHISPIFTRVRCQVCFLLLATLHPQLLLWGNTFRWYSWWTGLALITLVVALQPRGPRPMPTLPRALGVGLLLACLFYLNYITLLFAAALAAAMFVRYRAQPRRQLARCTGLTLLVFAALVAPQLHTMVAVHLPGSSLQRSSLVISSARLLLSLMASEAFLPWHPVAIAAIVVFAALGFAALAARGFSSLGSRPDAATRSLFVFAALFLVLIAVSGLGGKPRNGLLLVPVLAPSAALAFASLRRRVQIAAIAFLSLWSAIGAAHLLGRYGIAKASMDDRPEQVVAFIRQTAEDACPLVVTYDAGLSYTAGRSRLPHLILLSGTGNTIFFSGEPQLPQNCASIRLFAVTSYLGDGDSWTEGLASQLNTSMQLIQKNARTDSFSPDRDAPTKRRLAHRFAANGDLADAAQLPDYRYVVVSGAIDPRAVAALLRSMPDFIASSAPTAAKP